MKAPATRRVWAAARLLGGAAVLTVLVSRLGTGPFLHGLRAVSGWSLVAAAGIAVVTTVCSAWRWSLVARGLGVAIPLHIATGAYYRSQFLNTVLPGGVLGDVDRAVRSGRGAGNVGRGLRAVAWERAAGQAVQLALALTVLALLPSPVPRRIPAAVAAAGAAVVAGALLTRRIRWHGTSGWVRALRAAGSDLQLGLLAFRVWPGVVLASVVAVTGHLATFFVAARTVGANLPALQFLPLAMLVLAATAVPTNIGGWGPREGMAGWVFATAGLGADHGVATATAYGVLGLAATLPGALLIAVGRLRRPGRRPAALDPASARAEANHG